VSLRTDHKWAVFTVRDTWVGIAAEMLSRVFEPFTQEASAAARSEGV
jgi:signal transduction histidine kinase